MPYVLIFTSDIAYIVGPFLNRNLCYLPPLVTTLNNLFYSVFSIMYLMYLLQRTLIKCTSPVIFSLEPIYLKQPCLVGLSNAEEILHMIFEIRN